MSNISAVRQAVHSHRKGGASISTIMEKTGLDYKAVTNCLYRLGKCGEVVASKRGVYVPASHPSTAKAGSKTKPTPSMVPNHVHIWNVIMVRGKLKTSTRKIVEVTRLSPGEIQDGIEHLLMDGKIVKIGTALWAPVEQKPESPTASVDVADSLSDATDEIERLINTVNTITDSVKKKLDKAMHNVNSIESNPFSLRKIGAEKMDFLMDIETVKASGTLFAPTDQVHATSKSSSVSAAVPRTMEDAFSDVDDEIDRLINTVIAVTGKSKGSVISNIIVAKDVLDRAKKLVMGGM